MADVDKGIEMWTALEDKSVESITMMWLCDMSFPVPDHGDVHEVFLATSKAKLIQRIHDIITSPDLKDLLLTHMMKDLSIDTYEFPNPTDAIKAFFENESRNLFIGLVPVI